MMKYSMLLMLCFVLGLTTTTWAQNTDLVDQLQGTGTELTTTQTITLLNQQQPNYQLKQAQSCEQLKSVFVEWAKNMPQYPIMYDMAVSSDGIAARETMTSNRVTTRDEMLQTDASAKAVGGNGMDMGISETNVQVAGIDEPDIVKQDTKALYFYNSEKQQVEIYAHRTISGRGIITSTITLPQNMYNVQLMLREKQLIIIGTYHENYRSSQTAIIDNSSITVVAIYDISNLKSPALIKHYKAPGYYQDVRLNNNQLTVVSNLNLNLRGLRNDTDKITTDIIMPRWGYAPAPTTLKDDGNLKDVAMDCTSVWYPTNTDITDTSLTSIVTFDLNNQVATAKATLIAGNTQTVYMSHDRLYLIGSQWLNDTTSICPINARCIWNPGTSYTQVISLDPTNPSQPIVSRVIGYPLGQYAYHQDTTGNFYLVSQANQLDGQSVTHVWKLDKTGKVTGALRNLEPGEQFKSSRYIGDKLYLVTFEQIDPLFVIDLAKSNPTVLGELKIPGYSTYLHPYGTITGKTYLLGLGYDVDNSNGRTVNSGVKLDLYEIDYTKVTNGKISVKQAQSQRIGGPGTESEALWNPRMFVFDNISKTVYLPLVRNNQRIVKFCPTGVSYKPEQCYDNYTSELVFAGYKGITVTPTSIKQTKIVDYQDQYKSIANTKGYGSDTYYFNGLNNRVGYQNGQLWFINNWFMRTEKK